MAKTPPAPEFSRPLLLAKVPRKGSHEHIKAEPAECLALSKRFAIAQLFSLDARLVLSPWRGGGFKIAGTVDAELEQISVLSLEPFRARIQARVERYFLPEGSSTEAEHDDADVIEQGQIDLGEVAAEALALELDPYPRKPGEEFTAPALNSPTN